MVSRRARVVLHRKGEERNLKPEVGLITLAVRSMVVHWLPLVRQVYLDLYPDLRQNISLTYQQQQL